MNKDALALEFLPWKKARKYLHEINAELTQIIDAWEPNKQFGFYKARYRYGDLLSQEGALHLPLQNGELVPLSDNRIPEKIQKELTYSSFPISIPIQKSTEVFIELDNRVISLAIFPPGIPLGLLETLDPIDSCCIRNIWNISIGARSAFMIPKISDRVTHNKLAKEFNIIIETPTSPFDHFKVFKALSKSENFVDDNWYCDVLIMNKSWFQRDYNNYHWLKFNNYLHEFMIRYSTYTRNKSTVDILYQFFVKALEMQNKRTFPHLFDTLKHIVSIMVGASPAFRPTLNEETAGPFLSIQNIYLDYYALNYCPTIMIPHHFNYKNDARPSYCSMNYSSVFETSPRSRKLESLIDDLYQLRLLFETFSSLVLEKKLKIDNTHIEKSILGTELSYFHSTGSRSYNGIQSTKEIPKMDYSFSCIKMDSSPSEMKFSETNGFTRSCIRLTKKQTTLK